MLKGRESVGADCCLRLKELDLEKTIVLRLTVLPRINAAVAPSVAPIESATNPTGNPKR